MVNEYERKLQNEILDLKKKKGVMIFSHNYQRPEIQQISDIIGDSLYLAKEIKNIKRNELEKNPQVLYASVRFMAETAVLLNENVDIYFPVDDARCPMANDCPPNLLIDYKKNNPNIPIILYINSTTQSKQYSDVICTSSNAVEIASKIMEEYKTSKIAFGPDKNLGSFIKKELGIEVDIIPQEGCCYVHEKYNKDDLKKFKKFHPEAKIIVHPECPMGIQNESDFVGSTSAMYNYVLQHKEETIGIGTEIGLIDRLKLENNELNIHPIKKNSICYSMKKYTLEAIKWGLEQIGTSGEISPITLDKEIAEKARLPINKMFSLMS